MENNLEELIDINQIKTDVIQEAAVYAYDGTLSQNLDKIPYSIIPGIKPRFRCCVHREREIIRQRVSLFEKDKDKLFKRLEVTRGSKIKTERINGDAQIVQVLPSACEGCPIDRITVTGSCVSCLAQKCVKSCNFDAIVKTPRGAVIDKEKCVNCGACAKACPYHAIVDIERPCKTACPVNALTMDENDLAVINEERCINCGSCIVGCPFGAISDVSMVVDVINDIVSGKNVYAIVAPSIEGQFGDVSVNDLKKAIKTLGFKDVYEVALGADAVSLTEAEELLENMEHNKVMTSSCCPSFVNLVEKHYPELKDHVSTTASPMVACARYVTRIDENAIIVFIGPCVTKKNEAIAKYKNEVHYALTFEELYAMFRAKNVVIDADSLESDDATSFGKGYAKSGGVSAAVLRVLEEKNIDFAVKVNKANGIAECKKALALLKAGKCQDHFIEGMACVGGCLNGPAKVKDTKVSQKIFDKYKETNLNKDILETNEKLQLNTVEMHKNV